MTAARRYTLDCPQDPAHGGLYDWPGERTAWFCPNVRHTGSAFYTSDLVPVPRVVPDALTGTVAPRRARSGAGGHA